MDTSVELSKCYDWGILLICQPYVLQYVLYVMKISLHSCFSFIKAGIFDMETASWSQEETF